MLKLLLLANLVYAHSGGTDAEGVIMTLQLESLIATMITILLVTPLPVVY